MNEVVGTIGILTVIVVLVYGIYVISKPHKFQKSK
jgi:hypothetical protein